MVSNMQQFRLVLLDDYDNVIGVEYESEVFSGNDKFDHDFYQAQFNHLLKANGKYNFADYDNVPIMEYQRRVTNKNGIWGEWKFLSDPIVDYMNT